MIIRPYNSEDAESVFKVVKTREVAETTISIPHPYPRSTVDWWIKFVNNNMEEGNSYEFGLFKKDNPKEYVGNCGFVNISKKHNNGELGYFINPECWNLGYGSEACSIIINYGFDVLGLERIYGRCMVKNIASRRVMEKGGLKLEGIARHEVFKWEKYEDVYNLGIIRSDWYKNSYVSTT